MPALALRRAEAAAALGVSLETFDQHIRPHVAAVQVGTVTLYPVGELRRFLTENAAAEGCYEPRWRTEIGREMWAELGAWPWSLFGPRGILPRDWRQDDSVVIAWRTWRFLDPRSPGFLPAGHLGTCSISALPSRPSPGPPCAPGTKLRNFRWAMLFLSVVLGRCLGGRY